MSRSRLSGIRIPHVFVLLIMVIFACSVATYIVPSGEYRREQRSFGELTRTVVIPGTFETLPKHYSLRGMVFEDKVEGAATPVGLLGFLSAIPRGMESAADIIFFIFIIGGVFGILQATGTISAGLHALLDRYRHSGPVLTVILMTAVGIGGSTLGMGEEFIPLVPVFLIVSKELGYDRIYGLAIVMLAADMGFASATTNPFTVQIAQGIAGVPLGSGLGLRIIFFAVCMLLTIGFTLRYGARIKKDPTKSIMAGDPFELPEYGHEKEALRPAHVWIVITSAIIFAFIIFAVQRMGWWLAEMGGGFLLIGFLAVAISRLPIGEATRAFIKGMEDMVVAALVVGFAKGIQVVLMDGEIMDTVIHGAASALQGFPTYVAALGMLIFQTVLNFFIVSGSGQAAVTMPLMAPLSDVLGLTRQVAVFAFTCGDGFSNTIVPTSGVLMAMLALAGIPWQRWVRFVMPLFLLLMALSAIFLVGAVAIGYR